MAPPRSLFVPEHFAGVSDRWVRRIGRTVGGVLGATALQDMVDRAADRGSISACAQAILDELNIRVQWRGESLQEQLAPPGSLVVVGNHPFGILDGLLSMALLPSLRPDMKFIAQRLWQGLPNAGAAVLPLLPTTGHRFAEVNARSLRSAMSWLRQGHALGLFPAPRVATWSWARRRIADPEWPRLMGMLVARTRADILPLHFAGRNSASFHGTAALLDPLHHALLIREFLNKKDRTVIITVGRRMTPENLECGADPQRITGRVRDLVESLSVVGR